MHGSLSSAQQAAGILSAGQGGCLEFVASWKGHVLPQSFSYETASSQGYQSSLIIATALSMQIPGLVTVPEAQVPSAAARLRPCLAPVGHCLLVHTGAWTCNKGLLMLCRCLA